MAGADEIPAALAASYTLAAGSDGHPIALGEGAYGQIVLGRSTTPSPESPTHVAIKRVAITKGSEMARREIDILKGLSTLSHPNIVRLHASASSPSTSFAVLELVIGPTLKQLSKHEGALHTPFVQGVVARSQFAIAAMPTAVGRNLLH